MNARLGADAVCYSFIVVNLHHLLFAGFYRRTRNQADRVKTRITERSFQIFAEVSAILNDQKLADR
jgi:hypothetical protein